MRPLVLLLALVGGASARAQTLYVTPTPVPWLRVYAGNALAASCAGWTAVSVERGLRIGRGASVASAVAAVVS